MKQSIIALVSLFMAFTCYSQEYKQMIESGTYTVQQVRDAANAHFDGADQGRGTGYKQYKRWEYHALRNMDETGYTRNEEALYEVWSGLRNRSTTRMVDNSNWTELGPSTWNATSGWNPGVGRITSLAIDPANEQHMIVGSPTGGLWKSLDGGSSWSVLSDVFVNMSIYSLAMDPTNTDIYYWGSTSGIIFISTDAGITWTESVNLPGGDVNKILIDPTNTSNVFCSIAGGGIFRSTDGGTSWSSSLTSESSGYDIEFKPGDTSTIYASGSSFHRSTDGGASFTNVAGPFNGSVKMIGVSANDPAVVYIIESQSGTFNELYKSTDSGLSFVDLAHSDIVTPNGTVGINYFGYNSLGEDNRGQAPRDMDIAVNPANVNEVHIAGINTWRSMDGGTSFSISSQWSTGAASEGLGYCHADVDMLTYRGTELYVCSDGGLYKATSPSGAINPNFYTDLTAGLGIRQFYKIGISQSDPVIITGGSQDNGSSFYNAAGQWFDWLGADGMEGFIDKDNNDIFYGTTQNGGLNKSTNGGQSRFGLTPPPGDANWVTPFEQDPADQDVIYVGFNQVHKSINGGSSWSPISDNIGSGSSRMDHIKIAPSNNQIIYTSYSNNLYKTEDGGSTLAWTQLTGFSGSINSIAVHPSNPDRVAIATTGGNKVYVSNDGGSTWTSKLLNLPNFSALALAWGPSTNNRLYLGMNYGIYYIDDFLTDWQIYANNLPNVEISELEVNSTDGNLYAATYGRGAWRSPLAPFVPDTENPSTPTMLVASNTISISTDLSWTASTDNAVVSSYEIFEDGTSIGTSPTNSYTASGLSPNSTYSFTVRALDPAANSSAQSAAVSVTTTPPDTEAPIMPENLVVSDILQTTAELSWTASSDNVGVVHYNIILNGTEIGSSTTLFYSLVGLTASTTYRVSVTAEDAVGNISGIITTAFTTADPSLASNYCPSLSNSVADEYISRVQLETIDNTSDAQPYSDFSHLSTILEEGQVYTITVTPTWTGTVYSEAYAVWIDYNGDFDYEDAGELVWSLAPTQDTPVSGSFTVPYGVALEEVGMRVSMKYNALPTACETFSFGEVEDYAILLQEGAPDMEPPTIPTDLSASNTAQSSTDLSWTSSTDNIGVTGYELFQNGVSIATTATTAYAVTGLSPLTTYAFTVRAYDDAGNNSGQSTVLSVTTTAADTQAPSTPTNLAVSNILDVSAVLNWTASTDNVAVVQYTISLDGTEVGTSTTNTFDLVGLSDMTLYNVAVTAEDAIGNISDAATASFTTTESSLASNYCTSFSNNSSEEYISRVQLETIDNNSDSQPYSDFSAITTVLTEGETYTISVTPTWPGTVFSEAYAVWIDFNGDFDFDDINEQVWTEAPTQATLVSGTFTVPFGTVQDMVLMRVSMKYNGIPTSCENTGFGEVEDYAIDLAAEAGDTEAPSTPTLLAATNTTETTTDLNWTASNDNVGVTGYEIFQDGLSIATTGVNSFGVTGLTESATYEFAVRAYDAAGNNSAQSAIVTVNTMGCPEDITGDGLINVNDFLDLNSVFGQSCSGCAADINNDGVVNVNDFLNLNSVFGQSCDEIPGALLLTEQNKLRHALRELNVDIHPDLQKHMDQLASVLSVYPNPTDGEAFFLDVEGLSSTGLADIQIIDLLGQMVYQETMAHEQGKISRQLTFGTALNSGVYLLRVNDGSQVIEQKFMVK